MLNKFLRILKPEICQIQREVPAADTVLTQVAISRSGRMLFAGTSTGSIRAMKFPLTVPGEWTEHQCHSSSITKVREWTLELVNEQY